MTNSKNPYLTAKAAARKKTDPPVALVCAIFAAATASSTVKMFSQGKTLAGVMGILIFAALATPVFRILRRARDAGLSHPSPRIPQSLRAPHRGRAAPADGGEPDL